MSLNLGSLVAHSAGRHPDRTALIHDDERWTYEELGRLVRQFAGELLAGGLAPGEKVAVMAPNGFAFIVAYFGTLHAGGVVVSLNTLQAADEVTYQLQDSGAKVFVLHADCLEAGLTAFDRVVSCEKLYVAGRAAGTETPAGAESFDDAMAQSAPADLAQTNPDGTAVILYTSGTTGRPKGAELTHFNLFYNAQFMSERAFSIWPEQINILGPGQVGIAALPLYHSFGQTAIQNGLLFGGGTVTFLSRFTAGRAVQVIARDGVTFFAGVPTMYFAILHDPGARRDALSGLRYCVSGGAPLPTEVKRNFEERFGVRIQEAYGLSETSPFATMQRPDETAKCGTIGKPIVGVDVRIVDDDDQELRLGERGEIVIRGHNVMKGYHNKPEATAEALRGGWLHTGDIGHVDADGDIFIVDRKKDMILRGGYNVFPREVEEVLYAHPAVAEAAVIGIPDDRLGEAVKAIVVLRPMGQATAEELIQHCKEHVAAYKYPRVVEIRDALPQGPTGKILKRALRA